MAARMCLADGTIVPVNALVNSDLFWGIRGGHGQFGVVLEYTIKVYPDGGQALVGMLGYKPEQLGEVLKMLHDVRLTAVHIRVGLTVWNRTSSPCEPRRNRWYLALCASRLIIR